MTKIRFLDPDPRVLPEMSAKVAFLAEALSRPALRRARRCMARRSSRPMEVRRFSG
jgi:hypothetical protein